MATISSLGIGSGLDSESIVTKLVALEKQPLKLLESRATFSKNKISEFGQIQSQMGTLADVATRLSSASAWSARTTTSSNTSAATITSTNTAPATTFALDVDALAQKQSVSSRTYSAGQLVGAGTMTFRLGTWTQGPTTFAAANAAVIAATSTRDSAVLAEAAALATKTSKDALLGAANGALAAADDALVNPVDLQGALTAANAANAAAQDLISTRTTDLAAANTAKTAADAAVTAKTNDLAAANAAKTSADNNLTAATAAYGLASADLPLKASALSAATTAANSANAALVLADGTLANANTALATANSNFSSATGAKAAAAAASNSALAQDASAADALDKFANGDAVGPPVIPAYAGLGATELQNYAAAYKTWTQKVAANDRSDPQMKIDEDAALAALGTARSALATADVTNNTSLLATANNLTAAADATDASALKGASVAADTAFTTANATLTAAITAQGTAVADRAIAFASAGTASTNLATAMDNNAAAIAAAANASAALASATAVQQSSVSAVAFATQALTDAQTAQTAAAGNVTAANAALTAANAAKVLTQADVDAAAAALVTPNANRATALAAQVAAQAAATAATNAYNAASAAVTAANAQLTAANTAASTSRPVFSAAVGSADVNVTVDSTDTVSTLAAKINAANAGVVASVFNDGANQRLVLESKSTGAAAGFRVQVTDTTDSNNTDDSNLSALAFDPQTTTYGIASTGITTQYAQDAKVRINGLAATSATNTFADNVTGVTINVLSTTTSSVSMAVKEDVTVAVKNVQDFINAYNAIVSNLADLTKYDAKTKTASLFQGDSSVVGLQNLLRSMASSISTGSAYSRLSDVGIERQLNGTLTINTSRLGVAANNGTELQKLFTSNSNNTQTNGFAIKFSNFGRTAVAAGGTVFNKAVALDKELQQNSLEQTKINNRAAATEARLRKQYSALDARMANLNALSTYVNQQVTAWNKPNN